MALQTSGAISLNQIHVEAGGSSGTQASLNDSDIRALIGKSSGAQNSFSEYYGASADQPITLTISSSTKEYDLRSAAISAGWDQQGLVTLNINSGVYVWSDDTSTAALTISGSFPNGVRVNNYGYIMGRGGDDPSLNDFSSTGSYTPQSSNGGSAIYISSTSVTIDNKSSGYILGGGGAGSYAVAYSPPIFGPNNGPLPSRCGGGGAGGGSGAYYYQDGTRGAGGAIGQNGTESSYGFIIFSNPTISPVLGGGGGAGGHYSQNLSNSNDGAASGSQGGGRKVPTGDTGGTSVQVSINNVYYRGGKGGTAGVNGDGGVNTSDGHTIYSGGGGGGYGARGGQGYSYPNGNTTASAYGSAGAAITKTTTYTLTGSTNRVYGAT